jgi:NAD(P)-dependent dehydrogenase (short-subunit alcohol dehydrogenase family)
MKKLVLLTGATGAIGRATAMELASHDCHLILLGRNSRKLSAIKDAIILKTGNNQIDIFVADLSEPASIMHAVDEIKANHNSLNALINVAAIFRKDRIENSAGLECMFATNHLGPFLLTNELLDLLQAGKPSRIITVSAPSVTKINFEDIQGSEKFSAGLMGAFGATKMMNLMFTFALARRLEATGVTTSVFHPGLVKSNLTSEMSSILNFIFQQISSNPDKAAKMLCKLAIDKEYENSNGTFLTLRGKTVKASDYARNEELQEKLWKLSQELIEKVNQYEHARIL